MFHLIFKGEVFLSFSADVKTECCEVHGKHLHCLRAELAGLVLLSGTISLGSGGLSLLLNTESRGVVTRIFSLVKRVYGLECELLSKTGPLKKNEVYSVRISGREQVLSILDDLGIAVSLGIRLQPEAFSALTQRECCQAAFLRGAFLGGGSISDPQKEYHLEFVVSMPSLAEPLCALLQGFSLNARQTQRKETSVVYIKGIEDIIGLLTRIGAHSSVMELENIRIFKDIRNNVNRQINCESANIDRTVRSAVQQAENIRFIEQSRGLEWLSPALREAAELRLSYPEASLSELAALCPGASRSGINHRLRKLNEIARTLREENL